MSSLTMVLALKAIREGNQGGLRFWLGATIFLGLCFLGGQVYEFYELVHHEHVTLTNSLFGGELLHPHRLSRDPRGGRRDLARRGIGQSLYGWVYAAEATSPWRLPVSTGTLLDLVWVVIFTCLIYLI